MANTIILKRSSTTTNVPTAGELEQGELAINTADERLWSKNSSNVVFEITDHDNLTNFVSNEHINHTTVDISAGNGLTGGGDISATRTLTLGTPSTLTASTSNGVTASSHTHAITTTGSGTIMASSGATLTGQLNCADNDVNRATLEDYGVKHQTATVSGNAVTVNCTLGNSVYIDMDPATADVTLTLSNPSPSGTYCEVNLLIQMGTPAYDITWPGSVTWQGGSAPVLTTTDNAYDVVHLFTIDGGTNWFGTFATASGTAASVAFNDLTSKTSGTGNYQTTGDFIADNFEATGLGPNSTPGANDLYIGGYGILGDRSTVYVSNATGGVSLNYGGVHNVNTKLATTSGGVDVTGTLAATTVTGANVTSGSNPGHTHTFDNLTSKGSGTGDYSTTGYLEAGRGGGGVALTINDGQGNANVTFNHADGIAEQAGNVARIVVNTDGTTGAYMGFEVTSNASAGAVSSIPQLTIRESEVDFENNNIVSAAAITATGAITGSNLSGTNTGDNPGVTSVAAGNGLSFTTITGTGSVTMGTPSSITDTSTNSVTATSHTHAVSHTGTGSFVMAASPTLTGTVNVAALTASGNITANGNIVGDGGTQITGIEQIVVDSTADIRKTSHGCYLYHQSTAYDNDQNGGVTFSTSAASGGTTGDIWFQYTA